MCRGARRPARSSSASASPFAQSFGHLAHFVIRDADGRVPSGDDCGRPAAGFESIVSSKLPSGSRMMPSRSMLGPMSVPPQLRIRLNEMLRPIVPAGRARMRYVSPWMDAEAVVAVGIVAAEPRPQHLLAIALERRVVVPDQP